MRPAQKAPENRRARRSGANASCRFNEAGAKSAGKRPVGGAEKAAPSRASMRPAQKAPENDLVLDGQGLLLPASMRPAQKAPENRRGRGRCRDWSCSFNEAGAKSAGKRGCSCRCPESCSTASMRPAQKAPENLAPSADSDSPIRLQ